MLQHRVGLIGLMGVRAYVPAVQCGYTVQRKQLHTA